MFFFVFRASINALKEGEDAKRKTYRALCVIGKEFSIDWVKEKLEAITDLELAQHTPIRVLHRRADAKRLRTVYHMKVENDAIPIEVFLEAEKKIAIQKNPKENKGQEYDVILNAQRIREIQDEKEQFLS